MNLHVLPSNRGISRTDIEWADYAVGSPFRFRDKGTGQVYPTACVKVSDGCKNCYAESIGKRFGTYLPFTKPNMDRLECFLDQGVIDHVLSFKPRPPKGEATFKNGRSRPAVFFGDTTDIFGEWVTFEQLDALFACFALRPDVDFLLLTKRPERMAEYLDRPWVTMADGRTGLRDGINAAAFDLTVGRHVFPTQAHGMIDGPSWPLPNVWLGCSVENQTTADVRIPHLLKCPAAVRFLSVEPLLGPVAFGRYIGYYPMYEITTARGRGVRSGASGAIRDSAGWHNLEGRRDARESLERSGFTADGFAASGRAQPRNVLSGAPHDAGKTGELPGTSPCVDSLLRSDSACNADQPHQRQQDGQPPRELGTSNGFGEYTARGESAQGWKNSTPSRTNESRCEADRRSSGGDPRNLRGWELYASCDCQTLRGVAQDSIEGGTRRSSKGAARSDSRLHEKSQQGWWEPSQIGLVIVGGESGLDARPFNVEWARSVVRQCADAGVPCFVKQLGSKTYVVTDATVRDWPGGTQTTRNGQTVSFHLRNRKGGDPSEWPADLRVRQVPGGAA